MLNYEPLRRLIQDKLDKRFEELKAKRVTIEKNWAERIIAATSGMAEAPNKSTIVELYTNLGDMTFPSLSRKLHARETAWVDNDFFRFKPDGVESVDTAGAYWLTDYFRDNLNNELSQFHAAFRAAKWQELVLNISPFAYNWVVKPKVEYIYDMDDSEGMLAAKGMIEQPVPCEFDLQGLQFEFVSMFTCYPDVLDARTFDNMNVLDMYLLKHRLLNQVEQDPLYLGQGKYVFEPNVLYRGIQGLSEINRNLGVSLSTAERKLHSEFKGGGENDTYSQKHLVEVRTLLLKQIRLDGQTYDGNGRGVKVQYVKSGADCIPLFCEYLPFPFEQKTIRLNRRYLDPYNLYNDSEVGLTYNQHSYVVTNKQLQASAIANATFNTQLYSTALIDAFNGTIEEFKKLRIKPGGTFTIDLSKLPMDGQNHLNPVNLGTPEEMAKNIQLFEQAIQAAKNDIQQINQQVTQENGANATAAYNNQLAQELDLLSTINKQNTTREWLKPALEYGRRLAKFVFHDQKLTSEIGEKDQEELMALFGEGANWKELQEALKAESKRTGKTLAIPQQINNQDAVLVQYNPVTNKKQTILNKALFQNTQCSLEIEFETQEYGKEQALAETVQLFGQVMANIPDSPLKMYIANLAIDRTLQMVKDPKYQEITEKLKEQLQASLNPPPPPAEQIMAEQAQQAANIKATEAKAAKDEAQTNVMNANAVKTQQEVSDHETAKQLLGV